MILLSAERVLLVLRRELLCLALIAVLPQMQECITWGIFHAETCLEPGRSAAFRRSRSRVALARRERDNDDGFSFYGGRNRSWSHGIGRARPGLFSSKFL